MTPTSKHASALGKRLDASRPAQQEIWDRFARDRDKKAEATRYLVALALSLSPEAMARMAEHRGLSAASPTREQQTLLAQAEPLMRELGFLGRSAERRLGRARSRCSRTGIASSPGRRTESAVASASTGFPIPCVTGLPPAPSRRRSRSGGTAVNG
jgi:hypothetical protein